MWLFSFVWEFYRHVRQLQLEIYCCVLEDNYVSFFACAFELLWLRMVKWFFKQCYVILLWGTISTEAVLLKCVDCSRWFGISVWSQFSLWSCLTAFQSLFSFFEMDDLAGKGCTSVLWGFIDLTSAVIVVGCFTLANVGSEMWKCF